VQVGPYHAALYRMKVRDIVGLNLHRRNTCETAIQSTFAASSSTRILRYGVLNFSLMMVSVGL